ncbi:MAG: endoribonuclease YbeY [Pseudomonadota bacterium]|jgi:probable rRNA maturation factor
MTSSDTKRAKRLDLTVQLVCADNLRGQIPDRKLLRKWAKAVYAGAATVTMRFVDDEESQHLNDTYRNKNKPTNVLSFPYEDEPLMGDIVFCPSVIIQEAREQGKTVTAHMAHLVIHGMLHLMGYDHLNDRDAKAMESLETDILANLGFANPYA